jgi:biofilm PGA synthesis N-glycosyltransferase PgaC
MDGGTYHGDLPLAGSDWSSPQSKPSSDAAFPLRSSGCSAPQQSLRCRRAIFLGGTITWFFLTAVLCITASMELIALLQETGVTGKQALYGLFCLLTTCVLLFLSVRNAVTQAMALREGWESVLDQPPALSRLPLVSVLVPAFRESDTIEPALLSLVSLNYPNLEIIVVDDGSTDDTYEKAQRFMAAHPEHQIHLYRKPNAGKWSALNYAFLHSAGELVLCVDADSRLEQDAVLWLVNRMERSSADCVCGQVAVRNRDRLIARLQAAEYMVANYNLRTAQSSLGQVLLVPGPIGLYRRTILEQVMETMQDADWRPGPGSAFGPLSHRTFAEDFHLSLAVLAAGGRIVFEPRAVARTKAPDTLRALINQRYRWTRGSIQVTRLYFKEMRHSYRTHGTGVDLWMLLAIMPDLTIFPPIKLALLLCLPFVTASSAGSPLFFFCLALTFSCSAASLLAAAALQGDRLRLALLAPIFDLYQAGLLNLAMIVSSLDELRQTNMRWS